VAPGTVEAAALGIAAGAADTLDLVAAVAPGTVEAADILDSEVVAAPGTAVVGTTVVVLAAGSVGFVGTTAVVPAAAVDTADSRLGSGLCAFSISYPFLESYQNRFTLSKYYDIEADISIDDLSSSIGSFRYRMLFPSCSTNRALHIMGSAEKRSVDHHRRGLYLNIYLQTVL
jgi:hypothetical protein